MGKGKEVLVVNSLIVIPRANCDRIPVLILFPTKFEARIAIIEKRKEARLRFENVAMPPAAILPVA